MNFPAKYIDDMIVKEYKKKVSKIFKIVKRDLIALIRRGKRETMKSHIHTGYGFFASPS